VGVCRFLVSLFLAASVWPQFAAGQIAIYPLRDVRAGQHAIGKTVFQGNKIEEFQVDILGVLENVGPRQSIILARLSDGTPPVRLKLDSGTNAPFLYNTSGHMAPISFGGGSVVGSGADGDEKVFSALPPQDVKIGSVRLPGITFMTLAHPLKDSGRKEFDGLLSMDLFRRVFINHADEYAVLEPR